MAIMPPAGSRPARWRLFLAAGAAVFSGQNDKERMAL